MDTNLPQQPTGDDATPELSLPQVAQDDGAAPAQAQASPLVQAVNDGAIDPSVQQMVVALPQEAQDTDLIEKEWVEKAKQIVAHMSDDPYAQQQELSKVKADYMKKRYNKDIKTSNT